MSAVGAIGEGLVELTLGEERDEVTLGFGGDAANVCVMASRLGTTARFLGRVGDDALGRRLTRFWAANGIDLASVRTDEGAPTGLYVNERGADARHRFTYLRSGSAGSRLEGEDLEPRFFDDLGALVVTGVTLAISRSAAAAAHEAIQEAKRRGIRVACVLNHRPALAGDEGELAEVAMASDIVIGSREDLEGVFGDAADGLARLDDGPPSVREVAITDGARSAAVSWPGGAATQPAPKVEVRNAAGAGDAFAGAYLAKRLDGGAPPVALAWGVAAAVASVARDGCAVSYPSAEETAQAVDALAPQDPVGVGASGSVTYEGD